MAENYSALILLPVVWLVWNIVCFITTAADKFASKRGVRRVPERFFLWAAFLLGGPGVLSGFYICRHKTRHASLLIGTWTLTAVSLILAVVIYVYFVYR
jgi:uncharacterized membrane protein YsdA (DUF1294 family)